MMPDWFSATITALPLFLLLVILLGIPWTLLVLPRRDWGDRPLVACLALLFGPVWLTVWMFVLGTIGMNDDPHAGETTNPMQTILPLHTGGQDLLRPDLILAGLVVIALVGIVLAWRKTQTTTAIQRERLISLANDEKVLIGLIVLATLLRWVIQSWLPFGSWDPLWVYGYQGKIYTLIGYIPADIGYYPQFLPLQYAFGQIMTGDTVNDHAARAVMPLLQIGSILATYVLGSRLFNRRTGIIAAALWALYPHFGYWTRVGDLETPLTFSFTAAAAFFLLAWMQTGRSLRRSLRRRYALVAGLCFGVAMWTKPTAGAFAMGLALVVAVELLRVRGDWRAWWPRFEVAAITGLAALPLGSLWYVRNILLGHEAVVFPPGFWLTQAMRSGAEFGWPLLALGVLLVYLLIGPVRVRPPLLPIIAGVVLIALGVAPSILDPHRMGLLEWAVLLAGLGLVGYALWPYYQSERDPLPSAPASRGGDTNRVGAEDAVVHSTDISPSFSAAASSGQGAAIPEGAGESSTHYHRADHPPFPLGREGVGGWGLAIIGWAWLLALPYFITWFWNYSYHYRLSFPIVPLMILPTAAILAAWFRPERIMSWRFPLRLAYAALVVGLALPGAAIAVYDEGLGWDWLWTIPPEDDYSRAGLLGVVATLREYEAAHDAPVVVVAPGLQPLPFFFPEREIDVTDTPRRTHQLEGVSHFINSDIGLLSYEQDGEIAPFQNQWLTSLPRQNVAERVVRYQDVSFFFDVYELHLEQRFEQPPVQIELDEPVMFGDFARLTGYNLSGTALDQPQTLELVWQALDAAAEDYTLFVHLVQPDDLDHPLAGWDGPVRLWDLNYYSTLFWEADEYIIDQRTLSLQNPDTPASDEYRVRLGFYHPQTGARVPVTIDGQPAGDGYLLPASFSVSGRWVGWGIVCVRRGMNPPG
jgi:hypothetical protein